MSANLIGWVLLAQAASTLALTGLVWFVQIVHYPLYPSVGAASFPAYQKRHIWLTNLVAGPLMLVELAAAVGLVAARPASISRVQAWLGLALVILVWLSTALLQLPRHFALTRGFDPAVHRALVATNWVRTLGWTARSALALSMLRGALA